MEALPFFLMLAAIIAASYIATDRYAPVQLDCSCPDGPCKK